MANPAQHNDFGEKIGGARKDLWRQCGLLSDDLNEMNSCEADKHLKKDNVWRKPDYQAMIDGGIPFDVAYFIKKVRDSLNVSPAHYRTDDTPEMRLARQGMGTNVQDRLFVIHHMDCPWRPTDITQRNGRGKCQGNLNPFIRIIPSG